MIQARGDTSCLSMDSIFSLAFYVFFVHLLLLIKLLSILHSNALLGRLVYVWCTLELSESRW